MSETDKLKVEMYDDVVKEKNKEYIELTCRFRETCNDIKNKDEEIERLKRLLSIEKEYREKFDKDNQRLYKIINETSEILKFHLSNPSQTINGWHIDIWNSKDIEKLNKMLNIIEVKEENNG